LFKDYDAIYVHYITHPAIPILILRLFRQKKLILNVHGSDVFHLNRFVSFLNKFATKLMRESDLIVTPSQYFKNIIIDMYDLPEQKIYVSPSGGVDFDVFSQSDKRINNKFSIGYISRIDIDKGWDTFLEAVAILKEKQMIENMEFIVVGDGGQQDLFTDYIAKLKLDESINYYGLLPQKQLPNILNTLDLFVFPTKRKAESLGLVAIEAMACGVPVIGSNYAGVKDYIENGKNGFLFGKGDSEDLAEKIIEYRNLPEGSRNKFKRNALNTALKFEKNIVMRNLVDKVTSI
jgi:glycosyltransferase involved in cell wall biosynthesis